jgi:hypothetical protein
MQNIVTNSKPINTQLVQNGMVDPVDRNPETRTVQGGSGQVYGPGGWQNVGNPVEAATQTDDPNIAPVSKPIGASDNFTGGCSS